VERVATPGQPVVVQMPESLDAMVRRRAAFLADYQNARYASRYESFVEEVKRAEVEAGGRDALAKAVAKYLFKLMAYKDEYEVARLYTDGKFEEKLKAAFEGSYDVKFNLAPPLFAKRDAQGRLIKAQYGPWMMGAFKLLAKLRFLRGTPLDLFGRTEERRMERDLIQQYQMSLRAVLRKLTPENLSRAIELASLPEQIRGFGHVKQASVEKVQVRWRALEAELTGGASREARKAA
jgi:indolepyruvate ferredoxin oxidoreductase